MDILLASLKLETAFSVSRSGYMTVNLYKDSTDRRIFRIHRDILQALGSIIGDVKRIGILYYIYKAHLIMLIRGHLINAFNTPPIYFLTHLRGQVEFKPRKIISEIT